MYKTNFVDEEHDAAGSGIRVIRAPGERPPAPWPWGVKKLRLPHRTDHAGIVAQRPPVTDPPPQPSPTRGEGFLRPRRLAACHPSSKQRRLPRLRPICRINTDFSSAHPGPPFGMLRAGPLQGGVTVRGALVVGRVGFSQHDRHLHERPLT
jgi:hypothetical protein